MVKEAESDVSCTACDVEDVHALRLGGGREKGVYAWVEGADEVVFPEAVDVEGHEVVHGVVGGCDRGEDGTDCCALALTGFGDTHSLTSLIFLVL